MYTIIFSGRLNLTGHSFHKKTPSFLTFFLFYYRNNIVNMSAKPCEELKRKSKYSLVRNFNTYIIYIYILF